MDRVKVSPKYQIVIPKGVRGAPDLRPGQEMAVLRHRGRIEPMPMGPVKEMRSLLRTLDYDDRVRARLVALRSHRGTRWILRAGPSTSPTVPTRSSSRLPFGGGFPRSALD